MNAPLAELYDFAGFDGLALARALFGPSASELAVYQSVETEWSGTSVALLRLCENNFRVGLYGSSLNLGDALTTAALGRRVWVKPTGLVSLFLTEGPEWEHLARVATTKAPHRLVGLTSHRAVPARIDGHAALLWRHSVGGVPSVEVQTAPADSEAVRHILGDS